MPHTGKTILVVGGAGYIGSHMVRQLLAANHHVVILDNLFTGNRRLIGDCDFVYGDLGDGQLLDRLFTGREIDAVMHFAAFSQVGESMCAPLKYYRNNVAETVVHNGWMLVVSVIGVSGKPAG